MKKEFQCDLVEIDSKTLQVVLAGDLDEHAVFPDYTEADKLERVQVDFGGCHFLNSAGIKRWITFVSNLEKNKNIYFVFQKCRYVILHQINVINGFLPENGEVESLFVPLYCEECDRDFQVLKKGEYLKDNIDSVIYDLQELDCDQFPICKSNLELDFMPEVALKYVKS